MASGLLPASPDSTDAGIGTYPAGSTLPDPAFGVPCLFRVHPHVSEASGATVVRNANGTYDYWSLGDSDSGAVLARTDLANLRTERVALASRSGSPPVANVDWESLSPDLEGNLWIIDGGGNNLPRDRIVAYQVNPNDPTRPLPITRHVVIEYPRTPVAHGADAAGEPLDPFALAGRLLVGVPFSATGPPDIEASFIQDGSLFLIEKTVLGFARVFHADLTTPGTGRAPAQISARLIGSLCAIARKGTAPQTLAAVTDASRCASHVYLLTYRGVFALPVSEFLSAAEKRDPDTIIGAESLTSVLSLVGHSGRLAQAEGLVALSSDEFLISREDGRVFRWRQGHFEEPAATVVAAPFHPAP